MDVNLIELIDMYRNKLDKDRYSCLLFALQLPSICSRIEYPNRGKYTAYYNDDGRPKDGKLYRKWIKDHYSYFNKITKCFNVSCTDLCQFMIFVNVCLTRLVLLMFIIFHRA